MQLLIDNLIYTKLNTLIEKLKEITDKNVLYKVI